ncbi:MAG: phosphate acetyltransferase [Burkholderiaceae bacterium]|jgi:phosphate acetyltransferase
MHAIAQTLQNLIDLGRSLKPVSVAVCHPCSEVSLQGAVEAAQAQLIDPVLVGPQARIHALAEHAGIDISAYRLIDTAHSHESATRAVALCRSGECDALMKGSLHTDELMHEVMLVDTGLRTARRISHVYLMEVSTYPKMLLITDAAINIYPTLDDKVHIVQNAIDLAHALDIPVPRVAILSAVETVDAKIRSTLDAAALCKMAERGQISGALLDGPLAFDTAINSAAARIKGLISDVAGVADILVVPDLESGNMLAKQLEYLAAARAAGIVLGARVPIILTSRADRTETRLASCAVAVKLVYARRQTTTGVLLA